MVNIPLVTMDDYGLVEPTDVGTMTIDYDPKEDFKRRINRWEPEEVNCMLNLIKENNFVSRYSVTKMANILSQIMLKKGWNRTERQVHLKLTTLRKNFLACERQKLINGNLKECPFYKELKEIYRDINNSNGIDSEDYDTNSQDDCFIKFPNDPIDWTKGEVQKMLNTIKSMKLKNELTLTFFSPVAVRMIAEAMHSAGFDRSTEQVKNALINLRTMYIDYKIGFDNNENPTECMFYQCLDQFWGREYKKCRLKEKKKIKSYDCWSTEETIVLLTLIQDLNIAEEAYKNTEKAAEDLRLSLAENGYCRSSDQIMARLEYLKSEFVHVHTSNGETEAVQQFPFYNLYKKLFERQFSYDTLSLTDDTQRNSLDYADFCKDIKETTNHSEGVSWTKEEVRLLLKTVQELTSRTKANDSLEDEKLQTLVKVLSEAGYRKTAEQIKHKLALLKNSYLKCNLEDSSEKDIFECPFYNELHGIFHTPVSDERYEFIQNLLSENMDLSTSKFSDHSYTHIKFGNSSGEGRINDKVTVLPNKSLDTWFPVESIMDDDGLGNSTMLEFNNLSTVSNKERERVVEEALLAALPDNSDIKDDENHTIAEADGAIKEQNQEITKMMPTTVLTCSSDDLEDCNKIYKYIPMDDTETPTSAITTTTERTSTFSGEDEGPPPSKKPRIIEDEKIGKNKFLLRPLESLNPSSINLSNNSNKFVRLIVANEPNKNRVNHITAHIEPMNINTANSVSSGMSSPVDRVDILKLATEKILTKEDFETHECDTNSPKKDCRCNGPEKSSGSSTENRISETIQAAVQSIMHHDELMQEKHHAWMEKQFEIQRKHDEDQKQVLVNELKELRSVITGLFTSKTTHANNQNR